MRAIRIRLHVPRKTAADVYTTLADFERYPSMCEAVQNVTLTDVSGNITVSQWEVTFRAGLLRWTEEDTFDPGAMTITFRQLEGDIAVFDGSWQCVDAAPGSEVLFSARLDMGARADRGANADRQHHFDRARTRRQRRAHRIRH